MDYSGQMREWAVSITRIRRILNYSSDQQIEFGVNEKDYITGLVEFKNVYFSYKLKNMGNIQNVSFKAKPNEITAIVGHSGSGKQQLLIYFYENIRLIVEVYALIILTFMIIPKVSILEILLE